MNRPTQFPGEQPIDCIVRWYGLGTDDAEDFRSFALRQSFDPSWGFEIDQLDAIYNQWNGQRKEREKGTSEEMAKAKIGATQEGVARSIAVKAEERKAFHAVVTAKRALIRKAIFALRGPDGRGTSREVSLAITHLQEAEAWLARELGEL